MDRQARILAIDDNEADVFLLKEALRREGLDCDLVWLTDGAEGLAYLCDQDAAANSPDCILLDVNLPGIPADHVLRTIREHPNLANTPVLVWSSKSQAAAPITDQSNHTFFFEKSPSLREFLAIGAKIRTLVELRARWCTAGQEL